MNENLIKEDLKKIRSKLSALVTEVTDLIGEIESGEDATTSASSESSTPENPPPVVP